MIYGVSPSTPPHPDRELLSQSVNGSLYLCIPIFRKIVDVNYGLTLVYECFFRKRCNDPFAAKWQHFFLYRNISRILTNTFFSNVIHKRPLLSSASRRNIFKYRGIRGATKFELTKFTFFGLK